MVSIPRSKSKVNPNEDLIDELKRALHLNDDELLEDVIKIRKDLCRLMIDKDKNF